MNLPDPEPPFEPPRHGIERRWLVVSVVGALLVATALILAKPAFNQANAWRARSLAATAIKQSQASDWPTAFATARAAYQLAPTEPAAIRAVASIISLQDPAASFPFWRQLVESPHATLDDRRAYTESALASRSLDCATEQVRFLLKAEPDSAANLLLAAKVNDSSGNPGAALVCARKAHELKPDDDEVSLALAALLIRSANTKSAGLEMLSGVIERNGKWSLPAAALAARQEGLSPEFQDQLIRCLKRDPHPGLAGELLALHLELQRHPEERDARLQAALEAHRKDTGESLRQFALWLNSQGEFARTLELLPANTALTRNDWLLIHLDALAALKRWTEIDTLLSGKTSLEPAYVETFRARCAAETGDMEGFETRWRRAQRAATGNPEQQFYLASYAEKLGQPSRAEEIYRSLSGNAVTARTAYESLLRLANGKGTRATLDVLAEMRQHWPSDEAILNDFTYFSLLMGENLEENQRTAARLAESNPERLAHRTTLALAWLRLQNPAAALRAFSGLELIPDQLPASGAAVYAAVLHANGREDEARKIVGSIRTDSLRPEEQELVRFDR